MSIYSSPPPARSFRDDKATLLVCWWTTVFAGVIILFRVCGRYIRSERLFREDWLAFACLIPLFIRMALVHVILLYGTNNAITTGMSEEEIYRRSVGSRLVLASRIFYAATLWMLKLTISEFFKRLTLNIWRRSHEVMLQFIRWFLLVTLIGVVIADLAECQPVTHYWQVVPDPGGKCRQGYAQLLTMGVSNVITDLLLVLFPIPIIITSQMGVKRKVQLVLLFAGSLLPAGTTLFRMPNIIDRHGSQQYRSLLASVEILFATAVANALVLGSFVRDRGVKKQRWKFGSISDSVERTVSRRGNTAVRHWGSDEDLVRDLGLGVNPELRGPSPNLVRPAPMAVAGYSPIRPRKPAMENNWSFPGERSDTSDEIDFMKIHEEGEEGPDDPFVSRKVSFFDVGGLLHEQTSRGSRSPKPADTDSSMRTASPSSWSHENGLSSTTRHGSKTLLQESRGPASPRSPRSHPEASYELQNMLRSDPAGGAASGHFSGHRKTHSLQDVGGLLG